MLPPLFWTNISLWAALSGNRLRQCNLFICGFFHWTWKQVHGRSIFSVMLSHLRSMTIGGVIQTLPREIRSVAGRSPPSQLSPRRSDCEETCRSELPVCLPCVCLIAVNINCLEINCDFSTHTASNFLEVFFFSNAFVSLTLKWLIWSCLLLLLFNFFFFFYFDFGN